MARDILRQLLQLDELEVAGLINGHHRLNQWQTAGKIEAGAERTGDRQPAAHEDVPRFEFDPADPTLDPSRHPCSRRDDHVRPHGTRHVEAPAAGGDGSSQGGAFGESGEQDRQSDVLVHALTSKITCKFEKCIITLTYWDYFALFGFYLGLCYGFGFG